jgi:hypothetical protein
VTLVIDPSLFPELKWFHRLRRDGLNPSRFQHACRTETMLLFRHAAKANHAVTKWLECKTFAESVLVVLPVRGRNGWIG